MRAPVRVSIIATSALAVACGEPTEPTVFVRPVDAVDVVVDFCAPAPLGPSWVSVKNDTAAWSGLPVLGSVGTRVRLAVTPKVAIAWGSTTAPFLTPGSYRVSVLYTTASELAAMNCGPTRGTNLAYAPVTGIQATDWLNARFGPGSGGRPPGGALLSFSGVPTGPQDLIVSRVPSAAPLADKYIVRHNVAFSNRDTLAPLDFSSGEAVSPTNVMVSVPGSFSIASSAFVTNRGTMVTLIPYSAFADSGVVQLLPASIVAPGDRFMVNVSNSTKSVTKYFADPVPQALTYGPSLPTPTMSTIASSPTVRAGVSFASQPEYPSIARVTFAQGVNNQKQVSVTMTAGYLGGTPATWTLEMPELTGVVTTEYMFSPGVTISWTIEAWNARMPLYFSRFGAADGEIVRCALASSGFATTSSACRSPLAAF